MGRKYAKPPLVEVAFEVRISDDTKWDLTVAGLVFEKVRDDFPINEQRIFQEAEIQQSLEGIQQLTKSRERVLFFNNNRSAFIQIGGRMLAVNCLKPYPEWDGFSGYINQALSALRKTITIKGVKRLGLRYVNRIEVPNSGESGNVDLNTYFDFCPDIGGHLPQNLTNFILGVSFPFAEGRDTCRVVLASALAEQSNHQAFSLDIDYSTVDATPISSNEINQWINNAHTNIEDVFEGCILDPLRSLFEEVK